MNCENCYKNGHCWAYVKWFGCSKPSQEADYKKNKVAHLWNRRVENE